MAETGKVVWFDIPVTDFERSGTFYKTLFGWEYTPMNDEYHLITKGGDTIGGLRSAEGDRIVSDTPVIYVAVEAINPSIAMAKEIGAELVGEIIDIGEDGFFQWFRDRDKNLLSLWSQKLD